MTSFLLHAQKQDSLPYYDIFGSFKHFLADNSGSVKFVFDNCGWTSP